MVFHNEPQHIWEAWVSQEVERGKESLPPDSLNLMFVFNNPLFSSLCSLSTVLSIKGSLMVKKPGY